MCRGMCGGVCEGMCGCMCRKVYAGGVCADVRIRARLCAGGYVQGCQVQHRRYVQEDMCKASGGYVQKGRGLCAGEHVQCEACAWASARGVVCRGMNICVAFEIDINTFCL